MKKANKNLILKLSTVFFVFFVMIFSGCGKKEKDKTLRIGVVISDIEKQYFNYVKDGMEDYKKNLKEEIEIIYMDAKMDEEKQVQQVKYFIEQKVDAIIVAPVITKTGFKKNTDGITKLAGNAKISLVYLNAAPDKKKFRNVYYVYTDSKQTGRIQMEYLAKRLNGKGNVSILMGELNNTGSFERTEGVEEIADRYPEIKIVDKKSAKWLRPLAASVVEEWLSSGMELDAIVANNDEMAIGAISVLEKHGKVGEIMIVGIDGTDEAISELKEGRLAATVFDDSFKRGRLTMDTAYKAAKGEKVERVVWGEDELMTQENYNDIVGNK